MEGEVSGSSVEIEALGSFVEEIRTLGSSVMESLRDGGEDVVSYREGEGGYAGET